MSLSDKLGRIHPVTKIVLVTVLIFIFGLIAKIPVIYKSTGFLIGLYCGIVFVWLVAGVKK